jgi:TfoX/Sxy family transcriptional regulator of competence genes
MNRPEQYLFGGTRVAYDEGVAERVRRALAAREGLSERKMFGGLCLMINGNMFAGIMGEELMLRVGSERFDELLAKPGARPMDFTGRPMNGYLYVAAPAFASDQDLAAWLDDALSFVETLPAKQPVKARKKR